MTDDMKSKPIFSIILPTYNRAHCIERAVKSVINQTISDWELIVVDNNSTDNTEEIVSSMRDSRILFLKVENNGVVAKSRNKGVILSSGDFVAFLDSDDWWVPEKLETALRHLVAGRDLVYHDLFHVTSEASTRSDEMRRIAGRDLSSPVFANLLSNGNAIWNSSVVVRRTLLEKIGGFSEEKELVGSEDFDGWLRISRYSEKFERLKGVLGYYWDGGGNLTSAERTLKNTMFLRRRYETELETICGKRLPDWMSYSLARASLELGQFSAARGYAFQTLKSLPSLKMFLKSSAIWALSLLRLSW